MGAQSAINKLIGTAGASAVAISKFGSKEASLEKPKEASEPKEAKKTAEVQTKQNAAKSEGIDAKMAEKARRIMRQKIDTIYKNKNLSEEAKQNKVSKLMTDTLV
jgi:hypothetical protein